MADGLPNTNPMLGRLNKSAEETNELNKQIKEEGIDTNEAISEQLGLISSFTEVMKNYIPKLGFIDAHTQALKLKQDQAFKVLEKIEGHLAKQAEIREETGTAKGSVKPLTERVNASVNKLINSINVNAQKAEPDPLNPEIKDLLKQIADLSK